VTHALAGGARGREQNCGFSPCLLGQKAWRGGQKANFMGGKPSVEEGMAETPIIHICLTSRISEGAGCWRNRVFCGHFKTFLNCSFLAFAKKLRCPRTVFLMHSQGPPAALPLWRASAATSLRPIPITTFNKK
jgi:hypothetical protein